MFKYAKSYFILFKTMDWYFVTFKNKETFKCYNSRVCDKPDIQNGKFRIDKHSCTLQGQIVPHTTE